MTKPETRLMKIAKQYETILSNGRVLSNRAAVETLDSRIIQLANRIEENDMPQRMAVLNETWQEFREAYDRDKRSDMVVAIRKLDEYFEKVYHDYAAWNQLVEIFDVRRKLVDSEVKTIKEIKALLTAEDAYNLVAKLLAICIRVVQDPVKLRIIQFEFSKVIGEEKLEKPAGVTIDIDEEYEDEIEE